jgi:hypothetical protein
VANIVGLSIFFTTETQSHGEKNAKKLSVFVTPW